MVKKIKKANWGMDIIKSKKISGKVTSFRLPDKYKKFIKDNNINPAKLFMRACEMLDNSLKDK